MTTRRSASKLSPSTSDAAFELLVLLKGITADGRISETEVGWLQQWSVDAGSSTEAPIVRLRTVVEEVTRDGRVTDEEHDLLYKTIQSVLPAGESDIARFRRTQAKREDKQAAKERAAAERAKLEPVHDFNLPVVGVRYEGRQQLIARLGVRVGSLVGLVRDRQNQFSPHAVAVVCSGAQIGFVPDEDAMEIAPLLDRGLLQRVEVWKMHQSPDGAIVPIMRGELFRPDCGRTDVYRAPNALSPIRVGAGTPDMARKSSMGWLVWIIAGVFFLVVFVVVLAAVFK